MSSALSMESESARAGLWRLPRVHALHPRLQKLGTWDASEGAWSRCLRTGTLERLPAVGDAEALAAWAQPEDAEMASPWEATPQWLARAPTCVRWIDTRPDLTRRMAWTVGGEVQVHTIPRRADARSIRLRPTHALHPGEGEWLASPTPEGVDLMPLGRPGRRRRVALPDIDRALAGDLGGHPEFADILHTMGLRWDGEEIYLDCLRPATETLAADAEVTLGAADGVEISHAAGQGDRVYWRHPRDPVTWVLPHPVLAQLPRAMRHARTRERARVEMCAWAVDEEGGYLALWRAHAGRASLEMWSLRAHDRLKAWFHPPPDGPCRLVLRRPSPDHLPLIWAMEPCGADVRVSLVEFGDREVGPPHLLKGAAETWTALSPVEEGTWSDGARTYREVG